MGATKEQKQSYERSEQGKKTRAEYIKNHKEKYCEYCRKNIYRKNFPKHLLTASHYKNKNSIN